ncbi:MAG: amylo-alpha-1,6-glucosidase [Verrucomicrobiota bacterium]
MAEESQSLNLGPSRATISLEGGETDCRTYQLTTTADLRDNKPADKRILFTEAADHARIRTGNLMFDGLYAMAISEALANSVSQISDDSYAHNSPLKITVFQTGEVWKYVWTRDLSYSLNLALANFDPVRAVDSLLFKASEIKYSVGNGNGKQLVQDTGSGGSYPVSTDRIVWALGANETLKYLSQSDRHDFLEKIYPILCNTVEQDRRLVFDPSDGLYRGEQSFLDWREQTYPGWVENNMLPIAMSKTLSVNALDFFLLQKTAEYAQILNHPAEQARYSRWANDLKNAINRNFYDAKAGLYSAYLLSEEGNHAIRVGRYDLLGQSLAILFGIPDETQAKLIIRNYPVGPFGPPVIWPEEKTVRIYHNQAIWPFVTAYWIKAAQKAGNREAVDAGMESLRQLAAINLSNMENFDFLSGRAMVLDGPRTGPVINSRRQLWSIAGYLSMVQDVVFGLETRLDGIRFKPFITAKQRNGTFGSTDAIELVNFQYRGTQNRVRIHLPPVHSFQQGICAIDRIELNGKPVSGEFVPDQSLQPDNGWELFLKAPDKARQTVNPLRIVDVSDERAVFSPVKPRWKNEGITLKNNRIVLDYEQDDSTNVAFNIYRDGVICAGGIRETRWTDPHSADNRDKVHSYAIEAVDLKSGNVSHLTDARACRTKDQEQVIPAASMQNHGGNLVDGHHFENWGKSGDEIVTKSFKVDRPFQYRVRVEFANGAGPINTGITCAVKKLEIRRAPSGEVVASGYLIMPQSGDWKRYDFSSSVNADLIPGEDYTIRISEDEFCRNMSYLKSNERYTKAPGGGAASYNYVNVAALHLFYVSDLHGKPHAVGYNTAGSK